MSPTILSISGSPVKNSNTDRLVKAVLESCGLPNEFIKFSRLKQNLALHVWAARRTISARLNMIFLILPKKFKKPVLSW